MTKGLRRALGFADRNIGRCPRCMKIAFLAALASWAVCAGLLFVAPTGSAAGLLIVPLALTTLWVAHVGTYAIRVLGLLQIEYRPVPVPVSAISRRRTLLWVLGTTASITAAATVWLPSKAFADGHACGEGKYCPDDAPNCCSRSQGKCCDGNWACTANGSCYENHEDARAACGGSTVWACS